MRRLIIAVALTLVSATALRASCPVHGSHRCGPHFFSARQCGAKIRFRIEDKLYRMGLTRIPPKGDMHAHVPYETWEIYYYDRPYQATPRGIDSSISSESMHSALAQFYETRERAWKSDSQREDVLEYAAENLVLP